MRLDEVGRYARTLRHLRPTQVAHRIRLRAQRSVGRHWPALTPGAGVRAASSGVAVGWPAGFIPVDARTPEIWPAPTELASDRISLLGRTRKLTPVVWRDPEDPQLWRFHLHYWDWAWGLSAEGLDEPEARLTFERWFRSWDAAARYGRMDEWSPYVASLRAWSWCGQFDRFVAGTAYELDFVARLRQHLDFLRWNLERDVGGNHLVKNLKALVGLAVFFSDDRLLRRASGDVCRELRRQILADGGHYERSPSYHCQVMADVLDLYDLLSACGHPRAPELGSVLERMRRWLDAVVDAEGRLPLLNDGYAVPPEVLSLLLPERAPRQGVTDLPDTGLTVIELGSWRVLFDSGAPCPDELPAHAHADTLALELSVGGVPVVVDTGTSTYAPGAIRDYERSTAAHSTVTLEDENSTEVWGAFRAGRRARVFDRSIMEATDRVELAARHDGYRWLKGKPVHSRRIHVTDGDLVVVDELTGAGSHDVCARFHLASGAKVQRLDESTVVVHLDNDHALLISCDREIRIDQTHRALGHAHVSPAATVVIGGHLDLPALLTTRFTPASAEDVSSAHGRGGGAELEEEAVRAG